MTNLEFTGKAKGVLIAGMVLGVLCLVLTWFGDDGHHTRFWSNFLHNSVFFTGISVMAGFFLCVSIIAWAGWYTVFKRVWEAISLYMVVGLVTMLIMGLGVYFGWHHMYHWADLTTLDPTSPNYDKILVGKSGFLNRHFYFGATVVVLGLLYFLAVRVRKLSLEEEATRDGALDFKHHSGMRAASAAFLPIAGFGSAACIWLWIMSVDAHWYSTMFAWYTGASWFVSMIAMTIMILIFLKSKGYYENVTIEHLHDLGKLLFGFSIFWTYLWFSQYMLIWYANIGEETIYFKDRMDNYKPLFYTNLVINFVFPFFVLMRNDTKRKIGTLVLTASVIFFGHWLDFFLMLKPGIIHTAHAISGHGHGGDHGGGHGEAAGHGDHGHEAIAHGAEHVSEFLVGFNMPGFLEIGTFIGFLSMFLFFVFSRLAAVELTSDKDVYLEESLHHHA